MSAERAVIVCGGRDRKPSGADAVWLSEQLARLGAAAVVRGGAKGYDRWAGECARRVGLRVTVVEADWAEHGRAAGPIRNANMAARRDVIAVIAFPGNAGTRHMVGTAKRRGLQVVEGDIREWLAGRAKGTA